MAESMSGVRGAAIREIQASVPGGTSRVTLPAARRRARSAAVGGSNAITWSAVATSPLEMVTGIPAPATAAASSARRESLAVQMLSDAGSSRSSSSCTAATRRPQATGTVRTGPAGMGGMPVSPLVTGLQAWPVDHALDAHAASLVTKALGTSRATSCRTTVRDSTSSQVSGHAARTAPTRDGIEGRLLPQGDCRWPGRRPGLSVTRLSRSARVAWRRPTRRRTAPRGERAGAASTPAGSPAGRARGPVRDRRPTARPGRPAAASA